MLLFPDDDAGEMVSEWIGTGSTGAVFDSSQKYRYSLWRRWLPPRPNQKSICSDLALFIMLNPSTADATLNDPTITRCIQFAHDWGFNGAVITNIFSYRSTCPIAMKQQVEPIGEDNDRAIDFFRHRCGRIVAAWGNHGTHLGRSSKIREQFKGSLVYHLGLNQTGEPKHPLYLKKTTQPTLWKGI